MSMTNPSNGDEYLKALYGDRADWALSPGKVWLVHPTDDLYDALRAPVPEADAAQMAQLVSGEVGCVDGIRFIETPAGIELRTYGVATGIDPPEMAKLRNETMRLMLDRVHFSQAQGFARWTRGIAAVAVAEKKKAAESPKDIVEERNDVRDGWLWQVRTRRDGIVRERRVGRNDPSAADGFEACD